MKAPVGPPSRTMELALARYRLLFKHPFGTAHGLRDGTDSVFVRLTKSGIHGYGEATLPPYLNHTQQAVIEDITSFWIKYGIRIGQDEFGPDMLDTLIAPARAAMHIAHIGLINRLKGQSTRSILSPMDTNVPIARCMVTLGHSMVRDIPLKLSELPDSPVLKIKLGALNDLDVLNAVKELDNRMLFLDANQGWTDMAQAEAAVKAASAERVVGIEQPFAKDRWDLHKALKERLGVPVYGDESIQGLGDLERAPEAFDGVNLKLMKCGGLDIAARMAERARELGLRVMLGSMSESSLGCGAMLALRDMAELLDLDGPWLISNDPFEGLRMDRGRLVVRGGLGIGVRPKADHGLEFNYIGA